MNLLNIKKELKGIFSIQDLAKLTGKSKAYLSKYLSQQVKKNYLFSIRKGYFSFEEIEDKFLIATTFNNTYISLRSAIEFYELTTQRFVNLDLMSIKVKKSQEIKDFEVQFIKTRHFFGFKKEMHRGYEILIADFEKLLIDCILNQHIISIDETKELLNKITIDKDRIHAYLKKINSSALNKRIGYLLEKKGINLNLEINNKYELFDLNLNKKGIKNKKWRLILND